jgi:hypothetical protein
LRGAYLIRARGLGVGGDRGNDMGVLGRDGVRLAAGLGEAVEGLSGLLPDLLERGEEVGDLFELGQNGGLAVKRFLLRGKDVFLRLGLDHLDLLQLFVPLPGLLAEVAEPEVGLGLVFGEERLLLLVFHFSVLEVVWV